MGSKLPLLAALGALILTSAPRAAHADKAADLMKQGVELYKQAKYDEAASVLTKAYDLDHKPETLFALAQAERLAGNCTDAAAHYHKVIEQVSDFNVAKLVQQNLALCEKQSPPKPEPTAGDTKPATPEPAPEPKIITKTVYRDSGGHTDKLAAISFGAGMLGLGAAGGLYLAASGNRDAADKARTLEDHNTLQDRANMQSTASIIAAGAGVALVGVAVFRWVTAKDTSAAADSTGVAVVPTATGGSFVLTGRF